jgi:UrcA family protein
MSNRAVQLAAFFTAAAVSGAVGATSAVPALTEQKSMVVHYQPKELDSSTGAEELYQTLSRVARDVCGDDGYTKGLDVRVQLKQCEQAAIANAVAGVSSANLTTAYNRHFPNQPLIEKERLSERPHTSIILVVG